MLKTAMEKVWKKVVGVLESPSKVEYISSKTVGTLWCTVGMMSRVIAVHAEQPCEKKGGVQPMDVDRPGMSRDSGMQKMLQSQQNQPDGKDQPDGKSLDIYADFLLAYPTIPGSCV